MNKQRTELTPIKETKSVQMSASAEGVTLFIVKSGEHVWIPMNILFQVKRGLETATQKYYRKHDKKK